MKQDRENETVYSAAAREGLFRESLFCMVSMNASQLQRKARKAASKRRDKNTMNKIEEEQLPLRMALKTPQALQRIARPRRDTP